MLVPIETSGNKPPVFFVHGLRGFAFGRRFARALGPDQPVYVINANGMDGRQPVAEDVPGMVLAYVDEIQGARPTGPVRVGGMCTGCLVAIEIARRLQNQGRQTGPVMLVDPPIIPVGYDKRVAVSLRRPQLADRLYQETRSRFLEKASDAYDDLPFDLRDPKQLHLATLAGVRTILAFARYVPRPFSSPAEVIVSVERAPGFFHELMPWHQLLPGPRLVHVLPWGHKQLWRAGRDTVARVMRSMLEENVGDPRRAADAADALAVIPSRP